VELQRFFSDVGAQVPLTSFAFGAHLKSKGASDEQISKFASNPDTVDNGKKTSLFDLTEEKCFDVASPLLLGAKL